MRFARFSLKMHGPFLHLFIAIAVTSLMVTSADAQNEEKEIVIDGATESQVKAMIEKLASANFLERQQATKEIGRAHV